jgi:D-3-phosphoglycerate dehydrogenase / 2-oxoglutarate reductase
MRVLAFDPYLAPSRAKAMQIEAVTLDELLAQSDYITVHMPLTDDTRYMIDEAALAKCKKGVRIFNCARGGIIKESALIAALKSGPGGRGGPRRLRGRAARGGQRAAEAAQRDPHPAPRRLDGRGPGRRRRGGRRADRRRPQRRRDPQRGQHADPRRRDPQGPAALPRPRRQAGDARAADLPEQVASLKITYWGKIVDLDANAITRAILRGWLRRISGDSVNFVNAPFLLERLGHPVRGREVDGRGRLHELIQVEATGADGVMRSAAGTLIGKASSPRIVSINGREVEVAADGQAPRHREQRRARDDRLRGDPPRQGRVNIANMSLSRQEAGQTALMVDQPGQRAERGGPPRAEGAPGDQAREVRPAVNPLPAPPTSGCSRRSRSRRPRLPAGSLPFGYLVARSRGVNIFEVGSRSPGATNVRRVLGKGPGTRCSSSTP